MKFMKRLLRACCYQKISSACPIGLRPEIKRRLDTDWLGQELISRNMAFSKTPVAAFGQSRRLTLPLKKLILERSFASFKNSINNRECYKRKRVSKKLLMMLQKKFSLGERLFIQS